MVKDPKSIVSSWVDMLEVPPPPPSRLFTLISMGKLFLFSAILALHSIFRNQTSC